MPIKMIIILINTTMNTNKKITNHQNHNYCYTASPSELCRRLSRPTSWRSARYYRCFSPRALGLKPTYLAIQAVREISSIV